MAYIKIKPIKSESHLQQALDYILDTRKTDHRTYIGSYLCSTKYAALQFKEVRNYAINKGNNVAHHICQSFSVNDKISPREALEIGHRLMERMYPDYQYVIATHIDREHIHNHIIMNAVNFKTHKKVVSNKKSLELMRKISDDLCSEKGFSIITNKYKKQIDILKHHIDDAIKKSDSFEKFTDIMKSNGYEIKFGKYIAFKPYGGGNFIRSKSIGTAYTEKKIRERIFSKEDTPNRAIRIFDDKLVHMSYRKRLKKMIDLALKNSTDFDDMIYVMSKNGYSVKFGKHLAFRHSAGKKFIRVDSLGKEYEEFMLRLYFDDPAEYEKLKKAINQVSIEKTVSKADKSLNRYAAAANVNIEIKILNYLNANGIKSFDELSNKLIDTHNRVNGYKDVLHKIGIQISENKSILKALSNCWQTEPIHKKYLSITDEKLRGVFFEKYKTELCKYNDAIEIINRIKKPNGDLINSADIISKTEALNKHRIYIEKECFKTEIELERLEKINANIKDIMTETKKSDVKRTENQKTM